jgi:hypothetical protein
MLRKTVLLVMWFPLTYIILIQNISLLSAPNTRRETGDQKNVYATPISDTGSIAAAKPGTGQVLAADIIAGDGRALLLQEFMRGAPLEQYSQIFVEEADRFGLDYRLVPAIAMCESNLGKRIPSLDSYNAWGIAVYTGQQEGAKFNDWPSAIQWVSEFIHRRFVQKNMIDIKDIGAIWAPPSVEKGDSWATCVEKFMRSIQ